MTVATLEALHAAGRLTPIDVELAEALVTMADEEDPRVRLAIALVSRRLDGGHVCLKLASLAKEPVLKALRPVGVSPPRAVESHEDEQAADEQLEWPEWQDWLAAVANSPLVGAPEAKTPLVLDGADRLYLRRYWDHQAGLATTIRGRATEGAGELDFAVLKEGLDRLFKGEDLAEDERDWQRLAALTALQRRVSVISGGPGTGKTYTVVKILALLIEQAFAAGQGAPRMTLVAPTGKAAARLSESIKQSRDKLPFSEPVRAAIPAEASTIHRALGVMRGRTHRFYRNAQNPLLTDLLLVDEASMVDVALMARLIQALPAKARLILLGDKDQLASVEAGAVLGDICEVGLGRGFSVPFAEACEKQIGERPPCGQEAPADTGIGDCVVELQRSYRYKPGSGIEALANAINDGKGKRAVEILHSGQYKDVAIEALGKDGTLPGHLEAIAVTGYEEYLSQDEPAAMLAKLGKLRILCAHRRGRQGVEHANRAIEAALARQDLIDPQGAMYRGRPLIVTQNDYSVRLFNGDVGIIVEHAESGALRAYFVAPDGTERFLSPARVPDPQSVYATTVHKSQGSEFDHVCLVLPKKASAVVTRELLYTAVTRAKRQVTVYGAPQVLIAGVDKRTERASGLKDLLGT
ncbi:MAG: exodeoxyribonuclease V subunit alpha [Deltaproteobacteria bacterium]|nr:exodeoxyribonuclease V subunit alpha [Deltaproteobacteria bacterium]